MSEPSAVSSKAEPYTVWSWVLSILGSLVVIGVGAALIAWIYATEPQAIREGASKKTAMLVEVVDVEEGTFRPKLTGLGTVRAARDVTLGARVAGEVRAVSPEYTPGGFVSAAAPLLDIEADDYEAAKRQRQAELRQAKAALTLEKGRQTVARREFERLKSQMGEGNKELIMRKPQLRIAKAQVAVARAAVELNSLDLSRTKIAAPFDAQIMERYADVGSRVAPGDQLVRVVGTETYWIEATIPSSRLRWLTFPQTTDEQGSPVTIRDRMAWPKGVSRVGHVATLLGQLDAKTRMARVLVAVDDPMSRKPDNADAPPLLLGAMVEYAIEARPLVNVVRLPREQLRKNTTVWVMVDDKLDIRSVTVDFMDDTHAYISKGLATGDKVVITNLATVVKGAALRLGSDPK